MGEIDVLTNESTPNALSLKPTIPTKSPLPTARAFAHSSSSFSVSAFLLYSCALRPIQSPPVGPLKAWTRHQRAGNQLTGRLVRGPSERLAPSCSLDATQRKVQPNSFGSINGPTAPRCLPRGLTQFRFIVADLSSALDCYNSTVEEAFWPASRPAARPSVRVSRMRQQL